MRQGKLSIGISSNTPNEGLVIFVWLILGEPLIIFPVLSQKTNLLILNPSVLPFSKLVYRVLKDFCPSGATVQLKLSELACLFLAQGSRTLVEGVTETVFVGVLVGVTLTLRVGVGVRVGVIEDVLVGVRVGVGVGVSVIGTSGDSVGLRVGVTVGVTVVVTVRVGVGVALAVILSVGVKDFVGVTVRVGVGVGVTGGITVNPKSTSRSITCATDLSSPFDVKR
jgi:hypothetical protein